MSNLRHLIRGISQLEAKPRSPDADLTKYDKYIARMKAPLSLQESITTAYKLVQWMTAYQLGNPSEPWLVSRRLVRRDMTPNARIAGLEVFKACAQSRSDLPNILRLMFFKDIENEFCSEDFDHQIQASLALSKEGRDISGFDQDVCSVVARWIDRALANLDPRKQPLRRTIPLSTHDRHLELRMVIALMKNIMKFNFSVLDESDITVVVDKVVLCCKRTGNADDIHEALSFFDAIVRYGYIPIAVLKEVISVICSVYHGLSTFHSAALSVMQNLLKSHMSQGTLKTLRGIILGWYNVHDDVILGALAILTTRWTDASIDHSSYTFTVEALFHTYKEGLHNIRDREDRDYTALDAGYLSSVIAILGVLEISRSLSYDDWSIPLDIMLTCSRSLNHTGERFNQTYERNEDKRLTLVDRLYAQLLRLLETLLEDDKVLLPLESLAKVWSDLSFAIPASSCQKLLKYHINELSCYPSNSKWLDHIAAIGKILYLDPTQPQNVRVSFVGHLHDIAAVVASTPSENSLHSQLLDLFHDIGDECESESSTAAVKIVCNIARIGSVPNSARAARLLRRLILKSGEAYVQRSSEQLPGKRSSTSHLEHVVARVTPQNAQGQDESDKGKSRSDVSKVAQCALQGLVEVFSYRFTVNDDVNVLHLFNLLLDIVNDHAAYVHARLQILHLLSRIRADSDFCLYLDTTNSDEDDVVHSLYSSYDEYGGIKSKLSSRNVKPTACLPLDKYLRTLSSLIFEESERQVSIAALQSAKLQLSNKQLFVECSDQIQVLRKDVCDRLTSVRNHSIGMTFDPKSEDVLVHMVQLLAMLIGYHELYKKAQEDEIVATMQHVLMRHQKATAACIHTLTICAYEMPLSTTKNLPSILLRLSQLVTSTNASVHILEYLSALAKLPEQYVNFREEDYRRVFGISLQHIQYANATARDAIAAGQANPLTEPMPAYVLALAFDTLYAWFLAIKLSQRPKYLRWIVDGLLSANPHSKGLDERGEVCFDFLARFCYSNSEIKSSSSVLREFEADQSAIKSWLHGNSVVTMKTMSLSGLTEITIRRPSGSTSFLCKPNSDLEALSILSSSDAKSIVSSDTLVGPTELKIRNVISGLEATAFTPSHILLQTSVFPELQENIKPVLLMEDDTTKRALVTLDRIPVVDFHKIGIIYVGRGQVKQNAILSNTYGSPEYVQFLQRLGTLVRLKDNTLIYTGGLDTKADEDGEFAYAYREKISQIIFHTCTLMPSRPETDPESNRKKAHIGNDFVNIIWNSSNRPYNPQTIPSEFNFVNIVVSPDAYQATRPASSNHADYKETFYKVRVLSNPDLPKISPVTDWRLISSSKVSEFVRTVAVHCNIYAQIHHARGMYTSMWSQRLERIKTLKTRTLAKIHDLSGPEEAKSSGYDFTAYN